jgi:hypothetical protein
LLQRLKKGITVTSPYESRFAPVPFQRDEPPPGYTDFYGWHQGAFHGLNVTDPVQVAKYREEGRWFDKFGREIPHWNWDGNPNIGGGQIFRVDHPDPYQASLPGRPDIGFFFAIAWGLVLIVGVGFCLIAG